MVHFRLQKIPQKHILKRWTREARDILPDHLVRYQRDRGPPASDTFRHHTMYMKALECVVLGDSNIKCYDVFMAMMKEVHATLLPLSIDKDGMGLAEREKQKQNAVQKGHAPTEGDTVMQKLTGDGESSCSAVGLNEKKRQRGRPTNSRDKAPYEQQLKRSRFCTICREQGHKCTTCPSEAICRRLQGSRRNARTVVSLDIGAILAALRKQAHLSRTSCRRSDLPCICSVDLSSVFPMFFRLYVMYA